MLNFKPLLLALPLVGVLSSCSIDDPIGAGPIPFGHWDFKADNGYIDCIREYPWVPGTTPQTYHCLVVLRQCNICPTMNDFTESVDATAYSLAHVEYCMQEHYKRFTVLGVPACTASPDVPYAPNPVPPNGGSTSGDYTPYWGGPSDS